MGPGQVGADEVLEEQGGGDGAPGPGSGVFHVGYGAFEPLLVGGPKRHAPQRFAARLTGVDEGLGQAITAGPQSGDFLAQGNQAGSGEGGQIHHHIGFELAGVHQGIRQGEAPFGIGVVDLDGFAIGGCDDVAGVHGTATDHVFAGGHDEVHLHAGWLELGDAAGRSQHGGAAAHVVLHHFDLGASRFEVVATGIEGQAFAHQGHLALGRATGAIGEVDEFGGQIRALGDAQEGPHAEGFTIAALQHLQLQSIGLGDLGGRVGQVLGGGHIGRGGHQLARQLHPGAGGVHRGETGLLSAIQANQAHLVGQGFGLGFAFKALVLKQAQAHGFGHGAGRGSSPQALGG